MTSTWTLANDCDDSVEGQPGVMQVGGKNIPIEFRRMPDGNQFICIKDGKPIPLPGTPITVTNPTGNPGAPPMSGTVTGDPEEPTISLKYKNQGIDDNDPVAE